MCTRDGGGWIVNGFLALLTDRRVLLLDTEGLDHAVGLGALGDFLCLLDL